jgi:hypothetical protein
MFLNKQSATLVLTKFTIDEADPKGDLVYIKGRTPGLFAWFLTRIKFDTDTTLQVRNDAVILKTSSLSGEELTYIPLRQIDATQCGFKRSLIFAVFAAVFAICGLWGFFDYGSVWPILIPLGLGPNFDDPGSTYLTGRLALLGIGLLLAALMSYKYLFSQKLRISVKSGGNTYSIAFSRSLIENVRVDFAKARQVIELINRLVRHSLASTV